MNLDNKLGKYRRIPKNERNFYLLLFVLSWVYVWLRAIFTQMTHDETATFFRFVQLCKFLPFKSELSANNHFLNSFLSFVFFKIFGPQAIVLRLSNVLAFPLFFYFLVRIAGIINKPFLRICFVIVLALTHNLIEFFAMSRGYGLSMAFLPASLWFLSRAFSTVSPRDFFLTLLFAALALSANQTLLNSVLLIMGFLFLRLITRKEFNFLKAWKHWAIILFVGIVPVVFYANYLFHLKARGELYYGLTTGFWEVTVRSLVLTMLDPGSFIIEIFVGGYFIFIVLAGIYLVANNFKTEILFNDHLLFFYLLMGSTAAVVLLEAIFSVNYPEDRTGLYFVVYFIGAIFFIGDAICEKFHRNKIALIILPLLFVPLHFLYSINLSHNSFESHKIPGRFYDKIAAYHIPGTPPATIGGYRGREFRWAFLNYSHGGHLGKIHASLYPNTIEDFQIIDSTYTIDWHTIYDSLDYETTSGLYLLKRKTSVPKHLVFEEDSISLSETDRQFYNMLILPVDTLAGETLQIEFDLHFDTPAKPFKCWIVASVRDSTRKVINYEYFALDWLRYNWEAGNGHVLNTMIVDLPDDADKLTFYAWNILKKPYVLKDGKVKLFKYKTEK